MTHISNFKEYTVDEKDEMLKWFDYAHLPPHLQEVSRPFSVLASEIDSTINKCPQRDIAFQKLLEAKDAAVRASILPPFKI